MVTESNSYQQTTFDASGRRTVFFDKKQGRFGGILNMIQEHKEEYIFDGDGRPVIEKQGVSSYHVNDTPVSANPQLYMLQVWSSVLGSSLTSITPNGNKFETKVFAGGAVIAKQNTGGIEWRTSDPVTGTTGIFSYSSSGNGFETEETEPLGQKVRSNDPAEPPEPTVESRFGSADDPQWQCEVAKRLSGSFSGMPWHCQMATANTQAPFNEPNPTHIPNENPPTYPPHNPAPNGPGAASASWQLTNFAIKSTSKFNSDGDADDEPIIIATREPKATELPADLDRFNAEYGSSSLRFGPKKYITEAINGAKAIISAKNDCSTWFGPKAQAALDAFSSQLLTASITRYVSTDSEGIRQDISNKTELTYFDEKGNRMIGYGVNTAYRLFPRVRISSLGPFANSTSGAKIGGYPAGSLQSRIAQILHEIAHLIYKDYKDRTNKLPNLIEDDGPGGTGDSTTNTNIILDEGQGKGNCKKAIDQYIKDLNEKK